MPLVVVWMVTYNHENYIRAAIESVMEQKTLFAFKLLIGVDYSTDKTREICIELKKKYPDKIELFLNEKNIGATANGINMYYNCFATNAKFIAILDGDDYWTDPQKLQVQVDFLENNKEFSSCFHNTQALKDNKELIIYKDYTKQIYGVEDTLHTAALFHSSSFVFRKEALTIPAWLSKTISCDMSIFTIVASQGSIKYIPKTMSIYRKHIGGISNISNEDAVATNRNHIVRLTYLDEFLFYKFTDVIKKSIKKHQKEIFYRTKLGRIISIVRLRTRLKSFFGIFFKNQDVINSGCF